MLPNRLEDILMVDDCTPNSLKQILNVTINTKKHQLDEVFEELQ